MRKCTHLCNGGFTLIELSIVLVIVGLVIGGVLVGRDLILSASFRKVMSEAENYQSAIHTFRLKYNALPGDMVKATELWGTDPASCADQIAGSIPREETCNGNGDGVIGHTGPENLLMWQHLANAKLIKGQYTGKPYNGIYYVCGAPGMNIPLSAATGFGDNTAWCWWNINGVSSSPQYRGYEGKYYGATLEYGRADPAHTDLMPALSPQQAYMLDAKYDDGLPGYGTITAVPNELDCANNWTFDTARYHTMATVANCVLLFNVSM